MSNSWRMKTWKTSNSITAGAAADQLETEAIVISMSNGLLLSPMRNITPHMLVVGTI